MYIGSVIVNMDSAFASGHEFPYIEAEIATDSEFGGQPVSRSPEFAPLRAGDPKRN